MKEPQDRTVPLSAKVILTIVCVWGTQVMTVFPAPEGQRHEFKASLIYNRDKQINKPQMDICIEKWETLGSWLPQE